MAVYKRTYRRYDGQLTAQWSRFLVLTRYSLSTLFDSRPFTAFVVLSAIPLLLSAVVIYLSHSAAARALLQMNDVGRTLVEIDPRFFRQILMNQGMFAFLITAWAGPGLVAPDLANQALPLYLSRPFSRAEYVLGKMGVLFLLLSSITWLPVLLLFGLQSGLADAGWFAENYWMMGSIFLSGILWIIVISLLSLAISAWVRWRIVASVLLFGIFFVAAAFAEMINGILSTTRGHLLNIAHLIFGVIWPSLFRLGQEVAAANPHARHAPRGAAPFLPQPIPLWEAWVVVLVVCSLCLLLLNRRLRAREVVRG
jgi:ABC-2 type transport system permease protein